MVRRCTTCRGLQISLVHYVVDGYSVCPWCLGQEVRSDVAEGVEVCLVCGTRVLGVET
jgi:hypothetical protein